MSSEETKAIMTGWEMTGRDWRHMAEAENERQGMREFKNSKN